MSGAPAVHDGGWATTAQAERGFADGVAGGGHTVRLACTHFRPERGTVLVTAQGERFTPVDGGRAFIFPGSDLLVGTWAVGEVIARTAIEEVRVLGGATPPDGAVLDTQDFVRPVFDGGRLVLHVRPGLDGGFVPFEQPDPTPCCADHP